MKAPIVLAVAALAVALACSGTPDEPNNAGPQEITSLPAGTTAATTAPPAGPVAAFGDGTYEIGTANGQVQPGTYKTTVPADGFGGCYWERLRNLSGQFEAIIANANGDKGAPMIVAIAATDKAFKTSGCGVWRRS